MFYIIEMQYNKGIEILIATALEYGR